MDPIDRTLTHALRTVCLVSVLATALDAQIYGGQVGIPDAGRGLPTLMEETLDQMIMRASQQAIADPFYDAGPALEALYPRGWQNVDTTLPAFQGFPSLMPGGFGAYPGGTFAVPFETELDLPPALDINIPKAPNSWPSWFPDKEVEPGGFRADVGILAQASDYVWVREIEGRAFIPLAYWDRFRVIGTDAAIDVRGDGQFLLLFHDGARLRVWGTTRMVLGNLMPEAIEFGFDDVTRVIGFAADRPVRIRLGHAGTLQTLATRYWIEPSEGFVAIENRGPGTMQFESPERDVDVAPGQRIRIVLAGDADARVDAQLDLRGGLQAERVGHVLNIEAGEEGGVVTWSGARVRVPRGSTLRLDALAGRDFPENRVGEQTK